MAEQFANERKNIRFESGQLMIFGVLFLLPMPAKTAEKARHHRKEGPISTTVDKSGDFPKTKFILTPKTNDNSQIIF